MNTKVEMRQVTGIGKNELMELDIPTFIDTISQDVRNDALCSLVYIQEKRNAQKENKAYLRVWQLNLENISHKKNFNEGVCRGSGIPQD